MASHVLECLLLALLAVARLSSGEEACTSLPDNEIASSGEALLQTKHSREISQLEAAPRTARGDENVTTTRPVLEPPPHLFDLLQTTRGDENVTTTRAVLEPPPHLFDLLDVSPRQGGAGDAAGQEDDESSLAALLEQAGYSQDGYQGAPGCVPAHVETEHARTALFTISTQQEPVGETASLDAQGFLATTTTCCPHEMEQFFVRLLQSKGLDVCSKPHIQGLMHWFSCVPGMDFAYVLEVIEHGNPCKYWAPMGKTCPALSVACEGEYCGAAKAPAVDAPSAPKTTTKPLTTTTTTTTTTNACEGDIELKFWESTKGHNNVGGKGPDSGDEYLRIMGLGNVEGKMFDLIVSSTSDKYETPEGYAQYNGVYGYFGYLTMKTGSTFDIKFQFVEANTTTPIVLPKFYFTFFDLDTGDAENSDNDTAAENCSSSGYEQYFVGPDSQLALGKDGKGRDSFKATKYGTGADNPKDPLKLTELQQNKAVTFQFMEVSEFEATYDVKPGPSVGRDIYFAGKSQLALNPCFGGDAFSTTLAPKPM